MIARYKSDDKQLHADYAAIRAKLVNDFDLIKTSKAVEFTKGAFFLGEIPRVTAFEKGCFFDDPMEDDTALAFKTEKGVVVVSGCSQVSVTSVKLQSSYRTSAVRSHWRFPLMHAEEPPVEETIDYFRCEKPAHLFPVHCIDFDIQAKFQTALGYDRPGAGSLIEL